MCEVFMAPNNSAQLGRATLAMQLELTCLDGKYGPEAGTCLDGKYGPEAGTACCASLSSPTVSLAYH